MESHLRLASRRASESPIVSPMFERPTEQNLSSLEGIKVHAVHRMRTKTILEAKWDIAEDTLPNCPKCYEPHPDYLSKGWVTRDEPIKDRPVGGRPLFIDIKCRKYQCQDCGKTFGSRHPDMRKNSNLTDALIGYITQWSLREETHASIAEQTGVHESTVRRHFKKKVQSLKHGTPNRHSPEAIGIDGVGVGNTPPNEEDSKKDGPSTIIVSMSTDQKREEAPVIGFLPDQDCSRLRDFLDEKITPSGDVLPVVIDMDRTYRRAILNSSLPTVIVIDRYHVTRHGYLTLRDAKSDLLNTREIRKTWKRTMEEMKGARRKAEPVAGPNGQLTFFDELSRGNQQSEKNESEKDEIKKMRKVLKAAWHFASIMTCSNYSRKEALDKYRDWKRGLNPEIRGFFRSRVIDTVESELWHDGIMNFFEYPYTNGPVEGVNTRAKELKRKGAGYNNTTAEVKMRANKSFGASIPPWE